MLVLDNVNRTVKDDLANSLAKGDKLSIAAACFSIYAYKELKKQLDDIEELRFVFTSPCPEVSQSGRQYALRPS